MFSYPSSPGWGECLLWTAWFSIHTNNFWEISDTLNFFAARLIICWKLDWDSCSWMCRFAWKFDRDWSNQTFTFLHSFCESWILLKNVLWEFYSPSFYLFEEYLVLMVMHFEKLWAQCIICCSLVQQEYQLSLEALLLQTAALLCLYYPPIRPVHWFLSERKSVRQI